MAVCLDILESCQVLIAHVISPQILTHTPASWLRSEVSRKQLCHSLQIEGTEKGGGPLAYEVVVSEMCFR